MKVLIIGLDGASWRVLDDVVLAEHMPNLNRLRKEGASGVLESTFPAITPAAWTTCITGCHPQNHGLLDFRRYSFKDNCFHITNSTVVEVPSMWHYLSERYRVTCLNVPFTYPPYPVNGIMVSGLGCPGTSCEFAYPPEFKRKILAAISDYGFALSKEGINKHQDDPEKSKFEFQTIISDMARRFEQRLELVELAQKEQPADVTMVQFQQLDLLQHIFWTYVCPATRDKYPWHRDQIFGLYEKLDKIIGRLLGMIDLSTGLAVVASDHGLGEVNFTVHANMLLESWGYIKRSGIFSRMVRRTRRNLMKLQKKSDGYMTLKLKEPVNWARTKAMVLRRPVYGALYVNVKGRMPNGCISPGKEYDQIIDELQELFESVVNPHNNEKVFSSVITPKQMFGRKDDATLERFGDLMLLQRGDYRMSTSMKKRIDIFEAASPDSLSSSWHRPDGIFVLHGPGVKKQAAVDADIADIAPTIYSWLNMSIPAEVDGKPMVDAFENGYLKPRKAEQKRFPQSFTVQQVSEEADEEEQKRFMEQLKSLGYLE